MKTNYGLIIPKIETKEEGAEYILGSSKIKGEVINSSGDWIPYLPEKEPQNKRGIETMACSVYATLNALETLLKFKGYDVNYSDRYLAIVGKVDPYRGADPHAIAECIRKTAGCLREDKLPFSDDIKSVEDYYNVPQDIIIQLLKEGQKWYNEWELSHEWLWKNGQPNEKRLLAQEGLQKGVVCLSVSAWHFDGQKYYKPENSQDNHWTQLASASPERYVIFDSYDGYLKDLVPLYDFSIAKVYYLTSAQIKLSIIQKWLNILFQWIGLIKDKQEKKMIETINDDLPEVRPIENCLEINKQIYKPVEPISDMESPEYLPFEWDNVESAKKSVRLICKEEKLSEQEKNLICQIINCESGFNIKAKHINKNGSGDYGIIQANSFWYIGEGKPIASIDEAINNPEKCVRVMISQFKKGHLKDWVCYSSGKYKNYKA